jgi:hypothetical protein
MPHGKLLGEEITTMKCHDMVYYQLPKNEKDVLAGLRGRRLARRKKLAR